MPVPSRWSDRHDPCGAGHRAGLGALVAEHVERLLPGAPAPTTSGTHLRAYAFGHVRQLDVQPITERVSR